MGWHRTAAAQTMELNAENNYFCTEETNKWVVPQIEKIGWIPGKEAGR